MTRNGPGNKVMYLKKKFKKKLSKSSEIEIILRMYEPAQACRNENHFWFESAVILHQRALRKSWGGYVS